MLGVPQLFEDRWQQGGGGNTPPATPVKRGRGRPRKHPLPQDKGGAGSIAPRRPSKGSRRVHTDDEWSDWNESSYDTWQPEWTPQQPDSGGGPNSGGMYSSGAQTPSMISCPPQYDQRTPTTPSSPPSGPSSILGLDMAAGPPSAPDVTPSGSAPSDWKDDYCYSMTYDVSYILSTTSPENTQMIPRLPPTTDQSGNMLVHWHNFPPLPASTAQALYAMTGYEGSDSSTTGLPCPATNG